MKALDMIRSLIREERNDVDQPDETVDLDGQRPDLAPTGALPPEALRDSELARAYAHQPFHKLIVYRDGRLWEVEPIEKGRNFRFHMLKLSRVGDPLEPRDGQELQNAERSFDLDRGINSSHVTVLG